MTTKKVLSFENILRRRCVFLVMAVFVLLSGCQQNSRENDVVEVESMLRDEVIYANQFLMYGEINSAEYEGFISSFDALDIVLKKTEQCKEILFLTEKPDTVERGVIAFYSGENTPRVIEALNSYAKIDGVDPKKYGLSDPVTLDDVLSKRTEVREMLAVFSPETRAHIYRPS